MNVHLIFFIHIKNKVTTSSTTLDLRVDDLNIIREHKQHGNPVW